MKISVECSATKVRYDSQKVWWKPWTWLKKPIRRFESFISPGVHITEVDLSDVMPPSDGERIPAIIGYAEHGPADEPVMIGSSTPKPRWWQFWRWHLIPRYRRESREAMDKFIEIFGEPAPISRDWSYAAAQNFLDRRELPLDEET